MFGVIICNIIIILTTVYKAGFSTLDDLYNLITKIITKYPVLTSFKILKITKKHLQFFEKKISSQAPQIFFQKIGDVFFVILRILKVVRTGYFVIIFVIRLYKSSSVLKPALYTVVLFKKKFFRKFPKILTIF